MITELVKLICTEDKNKFIFLMKLVLSLISPSFCVIYFFYPEQFKYFGTEAITILSLTINCIIILILYKLLSSKVKVIKNMKLIDENKDYELFIKTKNKSIISVTELILDRISSYMIIITFIIICLNIVIEYIHVPLFIIITILILISIILICFILVDIKTAKDDAQNLEKALNDLKYIKVSFKKK